MEARRRSGQSKGQHGLTQEEAVHRQERDCARKDLHLTKQLAKQLQPRRRGKGKGGGRETIPAKTWWDLTRSQQWWLEQLWSGELQKRVEAAEKNMHRVQALVWQNEGSLFLIATKKSCVVSRD